MVVAKYNLGPSTWFCYFYFNIHMFSSYSSPHFTVINQHYNQLHYCCKLWFVLIFCIFSLKNQWPWNSPSWWKRVSQGLRYSQQYCWIFRSPGTLNCVNRWIFTDVWKIVVPLFLGPSSTKRVGAPDHSYSYMSGLLGWQANGIGSAGH